MSLENEDIKRELGKFAGQFGPATIVPATVKTINEDDTIAVVLGGDAEIDDVRLRSAVRAGTTKVVITPALNSTVLIGKIENSNEYIVVAVDEVSSVLIVIGNTSFKITDAGIVFNGGSLDGLVKLAELVTKLNHVEDDLNALKTVFKTAWVVVPSDGGAALKTAAATWANGTITKTVKADLENTKIKQ